MKTLFQQIAHYYHNAAGMLDIMQPLALLAARLYVAKVFIAAGMTKIANWDSTLMLFEYEYNVPLINFELAAWLGTAGELVLPVLLVLGLTGRFAALGLSVVNVVAVFSLEEIAPAAYNLHVVWGVLLAQVVVWGSGKLSLDEWTKLRLLKSVPAHSTQTVTN